MGRRPAVPGWWDELVEGYLRALGRRGRSPNTTLTYRCELRDFGAWISVRELRELSELRLRDIEEWQDELRGRAAPSSRQVATVAVRGLLKWAAKQGVTLSEPRLWTAVESISVPPNEPRPIPRHDLAVILDALAEPRPDIWWLRTRALWWLLYSSGARISEALSLQRGAISDEGTARVIQKGGRPHVLVVNETARRAIADYEQMRGDVGGAMFASLRPAAWGLPLERDEAQKSWNRLCRELGVARFTHHQTRHSCGTEMRRKTGDIVLCAKHLGHRTLRMMLIYSQVDVDDRRQAVALLDCVAVG